jgi:S-layer protein (TIGR01564 family)
MKLKRVGAVLAGAALLGATLAGAVAGTTMDAPDRGFFIDETTGLNNCLIVVGSSAAAADVVAAAFVSAKIGSMAFY